MLIGLQFAERALSRRTLPGPKQRARRAGTGELHPRFSCHTPLLGLPPAHTA